MSDPFCRGIILSIASIRQARDERVHSNPVNWLSLAGLLPLLEGENTFHEELSLPGKFDLHKQNVTYIPQPETAAAVNGSVLIGPCHLTSDNQGTANRLEIGSLVVSVIQRNSHYFLRVWDKNSSALKTFKGFHYFPVQPEYCIEAAFYPFDPPRVQTTLDAIGGQHETRFLGEAVFTLTGQECRLIAEEEEDELLFNFTDETRRDSTYPGGRFLILPKPEGKTLRLDFNRTVNWPCAYTAFATCPLPPFENRLPVRIEAGEKRYHD